MAAFVDWPAEARSLVEKSIERYGGAAGWARLEHLTVAFTSLSGMLPAMKGYPRTFGLAARNELDVPRRRAVFIDYPAPGSIGLFDDGKVGLGESLATVEARPHRDTFVGRRKWRRWSPLEGLYFFGYALTYYHSMPWLLAETRFRALRGRSLTVEFPPHIHTHCARQTIHFDESGLIVRHDYTADIVGWWAHGAHEWRDYQDVDGVPVATHRRVRPLVGALRLPANVLEARLAVG
jgi:hypothetical protein